MLKARSEKPIPTGSSCCAVSFPLFLIRCYGVLAIWAIWACSFRFPPFLLFLSPFASPLHAITLALAAKKIGRKEGILP